VVRQLRLTDVDLSGSQAVGAIAGRNNGTVTQCDVSGIAKGATRRVGGLVGYNNGIIDNCCSSVAVDAPNQAGGLVGFNGGDITGGGTIDFAYSTGVVTGSSNLGGLLGWNNRSGDTVLHSYWDWQSSGIASSDGGTTLSSYEMTLKASFEDWDLTTIWGQANSVTSPYLRCFTKSGTLVAEIEPADVVALGDLWRVTDGKQWLAADTALTDLPSETTYSVVFKDFAGWDTPSTATVMIETDTTATVSGTYIRQMGTLEVTLEGAEGAGAWSVDGGTTWNESATSLSLPIGSYTVTCTDVNGWNTPSPTSIEITKDQTTARTLTYERQKGSLKVNIDGPAQDAMWSIDGGQSWNYGGVVVNDLPVTTYTVTYLDVADWQKAPESQVEVKTDQTTEIFATYTSAIAQPAVGAGTLESPYEISTLDDLIWIKNMAQAQRTKGVFYSMVNDIDASPTLNMNNGRGWIPIGMAPLYTHPFERDLETYFMGNFNGNGHEVQNLYINDNLLDSSGLFGCVNGNVVIEYLGVTDITIAAGTNVGALIGDLYCMVPQICNVEIRGCYSTGYVKGGTVGGLIGKIYGTLSENSHSITIEQCYSQADVVSAGTGGGFVDMIQVLGSTTAFLSDCYATGRITTDNTNGGFAHIIEGDNTTINECYWDYESTGVTSGDIGTSMSTSAMKKQASFPNWDFALDLGCWGIVENVSYPYLPFVTGMGTLTAVIEPDAAITDGAQWKPAYADDWCDSGTSFPEMLPVGKYEVIFKDLAEWKSPDKQALTMRKGNELLTTGTYRPATGLMSVEILDPKPAEAAWSVDGGMTWNDSGIEPIELETGDYQVIYREVAGWDAPAETTTTVTKDTLTTLTAQYVRQTGQLKVKINPEAAILAGAQWSVDGGTTWKDSDTTLTLPTDEYTLTYKSVTYWNVPQNEVLTITKDAFVETSGTYVRQKGSIVVNITGPTEARWSIDGGTTWFESGTTQTVDAGQYVVSFLDVYGWTTPVDQQVEVLESQPATLTSTYERQYGELSCVLTPDDAVTSGAQWSADGGATWNNSNDVLNLPVAHYTVTFKKIFGWDTPQPITEVAVPNAARETVDAEYVKNVGILDVEIDGPAEGTWSIDGGATWNEGGTTITLENGDYLVSFSDVDGWDTPDETTVTITRDEETTYTGTYVRHTGSLVVTIEGPSDVRWSIDDGATWNLSGTQIDSLPTGDYTVTFIDVANWDKPENSIITVTHNGVASLSVEYKQHKGSLNVEIRPAAAATEGAMWSVDGGATWNASAATLRLPVGTYTVTFKDLSDWDKPLDRTVEIVKNRTVGISGTYEHHKGSLTVSITGTAEGAWSIDGGATWNASGTVLDNIDTGKYTIVFKDVDGWNKPNDRAASVTKNQTTTVSASYTEQMGGLRVLINGTTAGAWSIDGGKSWMSGGVTLPELSVKEYTVTFKDVESFITPDPQTVKVVYGVITQISATYIEAIDIILDDADFTAGVSSSLQSGQKVDMTWQASSTRAFTDPFWLEIFASKTGGFDQVRLGVAMTGSHRVTDGMSTSETFTPSNLALNPIADGTYTLMPSINRGTISDAVSEYNYVNNWMPIAGKRLMVNNRYAPSVDLWLSEAEAIVDPNNPKACTVVGTVQNIGKTDLVKPGCWIEVFYGTLTAESVLMPQGTIGAGLKLPTLAAGEATSFTLSGSVPNGVASRALSVVVDSTDIVPELIETNNFRLLFNPGVLPAGKDNNIDLCITTVKVDAEQLAPNMVVPGDKLRWGVIVENKGKVMPTGQVYLELFASQDGGASVVPGRTLTWSRLVDPPAVGEFSTYYIEEPINDIGNGLYSMTAIINRTGLAANPGDMTPLDNVYHYSEGRVSVTVPKNAMGGKNLVWAEGPIFTQDSATTVTITGVIKNEGTQKTGAFWTEAFNGTVQKKTGYFFRSSNFAGGQHCPGLAPGETQNISIVGKSVDGKIIGVLTDSTDTVAETDETDNYDYSELLAE